MEPYLLVIGILSVWSHRHDFRNHRTEGQNPYGAVLKDQTADQAEQCSNALQAHTFQ